MDGTLHFDEPSHIYTVVTPTERVVIPSVGTIIEPIRDSVLTCTIPKVVANVARARDRGKAVHKATQLYDLGVPFDMGPDADVIWPYLEGWIKFREDNDWVWDALEEPDYHRTLMYAGTPDRKGRLNGRRGGVDIKCTAKASPATGVQLGGYELFEAEPWEIRIGVRLQKTGKYEITNYPDERVTFRSLLNVYNWKKAHP